MKLGYVGLGKMGFGMVELLLEKGHEIVAYNRHEDAVKEIAKKGAIGADNLKHLVSLLSAPRTVWLMVPHQAVDEVISDIVPHMQKGDVIIDGGNSPYKESIRRGKELEAKGIDFLDAGVSGGPAGARNGACIMIGGKKEVFKRYESLFRDLTVENGYRYMGPSGAGHFVKMVHNGIEYGMMQAIAEGFAVMKASPFNLNLTDVTDIYNHKSVVESRLVGWLKSGFEKYGEDLEKISGSVAHTGEGLWTVEAAREFGVSVPIIEGSLNFRNESQKNPSYTGQVVSVLRNQFGQHEAGEKEK